MMMRQEKTGIKVDGGMSCNNLLCQFLADISDRVIWRPKQTEATALGAAMIAGFHIGLWDINCPSVEDEGLIGKITRSLSFTRDREDANPRKYDIFWPKLDEKTRGDRINTWKMAVNRSRKWIRVEKQELKKINYKRLSSLPFMFYILISFGTHILSQIQ